MKLYTLALLFFGVALVQNVSADDSVISGALIHNAVQNGVEKKIDDLLEEKLQMNISNKKLFDKFYNDV